MTEGKGKKAGREKAQYFDRGKEWTLQEYTEQALSSLDNRSSSNTSLSLWKKKPNKTGILAESSSWLPKLAFWKRDSAIIFTKQWRAERWLCCFQEVWDLSSSVHFPWLLGIFLLAPELNTPAEVFLPCLAYFPSQGYAVWSDQGWNPNSAPWAVSGMLCTDLLFLLLDAPVPSSAGWDQNPQGIPRKCSSSHSQKFPSPAGNLPRKKPDPSHKDIKAKSAKL